MTLDQADAFDRKVLSHFLNADGRLERLPARHKKLLAVLRYCNRLFEPDIHYTEKEVNQILGHVHEDTASLRRALVDNAFMTRSGGIYWRIDKDSTDPRARTDG